MSRQNFAIEMLLLLMLCGCKSFVPFTAEHYKEFESRLSEIQFYNSQEIRIERSSETEEISVDNYAPAIRRSKNLFVVTIPRYTQGVLRRIENDTLYVQFEPSDEEGEKLVPFVKVPKYRHQGQKKISDVYLFSDSKLTYGGSICNVIFRQKKVRVDEEDTDVYVGVKDDHSDKHYVVKTLYPILNVSPTELDENTYKSYTIAPGIKVEKEK